MTHVLGRSVLAACLLMASLLPSMAAAAPAYTRPVKAQLRKALNLSRQESVKIRTTRIIKPPAMEKTRLYELRSGTMSITGPAGQREGTFLFKVFRSGRVKVVSTEAK